MKKYLQWMTALRWGINVSHKTTLRDSELWPVVASTLDDPRKTKSEVPLLWHWWDCIKGSTKWLSIYMQTNQITNRNKFLRKKDDEAQILLQGEASTKRRGHRHQPHQICCLGCWSEGDSPWRMFQEFAVEQRLQRDPTPKLQQSHHLAQQYL